MSAEPKTLGSEICSINSHLLQVQRHYRDIIARELPASISTELPGTYILESENLPFCPQIFREVCLRLAPQLSRQNPEADFVPLLSRLDDAKLSQLATAMQNAPEQDLPLALELAIREVRIDKLFTSNLEALHMLFLAAFVPFFSAFAQQQSEMSLERWQKGWCPVCGQYPVNGYNRPGDGRRVLGCWMCETQWTYSRMGCPVCSSLSQDGQLLLTPLGGDGTRRIQVCEDCGHYLKVTDCTEASGECDLVLENAATVHLDVLAQRKGYRPASQPQRLES